MLLQPYVENAIIHGLRHKEGEKGMLSISIRSEADKLFVTIEDNGIGRIKAAEINEMNNKFHRQLGMELTGRRIELLKTITTHKISVKITDLQDGVNTGTRVQISLPLEYAVYNNN